MIAIVYVQGHLVGEIEFELPKTYEGTPLKVGPTSMATVILIESPPPRNAKPLFLTGMLEHA